MIASVFSTFGNLHMIFSRSVLLKVGRLLEQEQKKQESDGKSGSSAAASFTDAFFETFLIEGVVSFRFDRVMVLTDNVYLS